jgi:hypothetical protein
MQRTPQWLDRRSLEFHRRIAEEIRRDPSHLERARQNLVRWKANDRRGCPGWDTWLSVLDQGVEATIATMLDAGERGQYLRSCTPFTRVLTPRSRADFLRQWSASS